MGFIKKLKYFGQKMPEQVADRTSVKQDVTNKVNKVKKDRRKVVKLTTVNLLSDRFERVIEILYVFINILIICGTLFMIIVIVDDSYINNLLILLVLFGALILYIINILQFGFFSTLLRIRDGIENLNKN